MIMKAICVLCPMNETDVETGKKPCSKKGKISIKT